MSRYITQTIYLNFPKWPAIWNGGSIVWQRYYTRLPHYAAIIRLDDDTIRRPHYLLLNHRPKKWKRSSMRNLIQHVLERSSKIGRTWAGLNDNELWLSKDDNDTTSNVKLQKKKNLQRSSEDGWSCTASFEWMWWSTPTLVDYNRSDNRLGFPWRKKTCHREKKRCSCVGPWANIIFWSMSAGWLVGQRFTS